MQCRFKMEYRLFTIVRYNYRDYNSVLCLPLYTSAGVLCKDNTHPFSPTHIQQTDTGSSVRQRLRTKTSRQRSKLAEGSQEGEKGSER